MTWALTNAKKSRAKRKKERKRQAAKTPTAPKQRNVIAEQMLLRRMGTGGSGGHGRVSRKTERRKAKQGLQDLGKENPRFGSTPSVEHARNELREQGFFSTHYVGELQTPSGPVLVFNATFMGDGPYRVHVGRFVNSDHLDVRKQRLSDLESLAALAGEGRRNPGYLPDVREAEGTPSEILAVYRDLVAWNKSHGKRGIHTAMNLVKWGPSPASTPITKPDTMELLAWVSREMEDAGLAERGAVSSARIHVVDNKPIEINVYVNDQAIDLLVDILLSMRGEGSREQRKEASLLVRQLLSLRGSHAGVEEIQANPKMYGSLPERGHVENELRKAGWYDFTFISKSVHPDRGPVYVYEATIHSAAAGHRRFRINVGRLNRTDHLDIRSSRIAESNPSVGDLRQVAKKHGFEFVGQFEPEGWKGSEVMMTVRKGGQNYFTVYDPKTGRMWANDGSEQIMPARSNPTKAASRRAKKRYARRAWGTGPGERLEDFSKVSDEEVIERLRFLASQTDFFDADNPVEYRDVAYALLYPADLGMPFSHMSPRQREKAARTMARERDPGTIERDRLTSAQNEAVTRNLSKIRKAVHSGGWDEPPLPPEYNPTRSNPASYRSAAIAMPSSAQLGGPSRSNCARPSWLAYPNPGVESDFDPREEQMRAQTVKIFKSSLKGGENFDDLRGLSSRAFAIATGRGHKYGWFYPGTRIPTPKTIKASQARYEGTYKGSDKKRRTLDDLINNRQMYESMLGLARVGGNFYRVTEEPTQQGPRYFVWPMPAGQRVPAPHRDRGAAERQADQLNRTANPLKGTAPPRTDLTGYTKAELADWLPPASAFAVAKKPKEKSKGVPAARLPRRSTSPVQAPALSVKCEIRGGERIYFLADHSGLQASPNFHDFSAAYAALKRTA